jgi:RsmE family RNA methyltransferase
MNIILFDQEEIQGSSVLLDGDRARHIVRVLRAEPGETIKVGIINGRMGQGTIIETRVKQPYSVRLDMVFDREPGFTPQIDIMLALPRPIMFRRILSQAAALGIGHLYVVNANRVEKSFWSGSMIEPRVCRKYLVEGLEQAVDTMLPSLTFHKGFRPFLEEDLARAGSSYGQMLTAHPAAPHNLRSVFRPGQGRTLLAVGPEGGWVDYEIMKMEEAGFTMFTMGPRILKVETAVTALHSGVTRLSE